MPDTQNADVEARQAECGRSSFCVARRGSRGVLFISAALAVNGLLVTPASTAAEAVVPIEEIVVTATRARRTLAETPRSVTIISETDVQNQLDMAQDFTTLLSQLVPGMNTSVHGFSNAQGQDQIRGRRLQLVIDGVVVNNGWLDFRQEFQTIDPDNIERIEVIRGGTAVYGFGAAGGIISIRTKTAVGGEPEFTSQVRGSFQPTEISDSFSYKVSQSANFSVNDLDVRLFGAYRRVANRFDGDGDRIPSDFNEDNTDQYTLAGSMRYNIDVGQYLEGTANYFEIKEYERWLPVGASAVDRVKASAVRVGVGIDSLQVAERIDSAPAPYNRTQLYRLGYVNEDLLGSSMDLTGYYQRQSSRTDTLIFNTGVPEEERPHGFNHPTLKRYGARLTFDTPIRELFTGRSSVVWGLDYEYNSYFQPNTAGLEPITPPMTADTYAGFLQLDLGLTERLLFSGGVRYEDVRVHFKDFVVSETMSNRGNFVAGGTVGFDEFVFNAGLIYKLGADHDLFVSYSQGFATGEILRAVRNTAASSVRSAAELRAQIIHNYEVGIRGNTGNLHYTLAGFYSESNLGVTFGLDPATDLSIIMRAPEEMWGVEATVDYAPRTELGFGGTISWQEGNHRPDTTMPWEPLPNNRIAPIKVTAYADYQPRDWLRLRASLLNSGSRDKFPGSTTFAEGKVHDLYLLDLSASAALPVGELTLAVANVFDKQYIPPSLEGFNNDFRYLAGPGRMITTTYRVTW